MNLYKVKSILNSIIFFLLILGSSSVYSQDISFNVRVSSDTLLQGNIIKAKFEIKNTDGDFEPPSFDGWLLVGGPNSSSQYSMINGKVTQSSGYEYILQAPEEGSLVIEPATLKTKDQTLTTDPVFITVLPNPEGKQIRPQGYGYRQEILVKPALRDSMSPQDSLKLKLSKLKSTKI